MSPALLLPIAARNFLFRCWERLTVSRLLLICSSLVALQFALLLLLLLAGCSSSDGHPSAPIRTAPLLAPTPTQTLPNPSAKWPQDPQPPQQVAGPLGALGVLSAWGFSRRLRRRIKGGR